MTRVNLVRLRLKVESVQLFGSDEVPYYIIDEHEFCEASDGGFLRAPELRTDYAPVMHIAGYGRPDVYVAHTEEVERLLGIPIRTILRERNCFENEARGLRNHVDFLERALRIRANMPFVERLKFLFIGKYYLPKDLK